MEKIYEAHKNHQRVWQEVKANKFSEWKVTLTNAPIEMHLKANGYAYKAAEPQARVRDETLKQLFEGMPFDRFRSGDQMAIDTVLDFLEVDVPAFQCGYAKERCYRRLKHLNLTDKQHQRLRQLALDMCQGQGYRREMIDLARLMIRLADKKFIEELYRAGKDSDKYKAKKAQRMLQVILHSRCDLKPDAK